ncbi:MKI67 FHA domain-interacting nucleolar phosphoprotein-like [Mytilus californianus]|uniref:MKI67 FHA domain-interacting nucleolar phosphoprotein-like n=1 Tax=Mytilus californianus TaxID=6549 RepID=UPI00224605F2|nr:MKI67 FHA domain-interacting nucleolar phosphoprotein-like [Mytilus californianus]
MASPRQKRVTRKSKETSLPETVALDEDKQKSFETKLKTIKKNSKELTSPGVVYLGNIPHGFFEPQMKDFFRQFGKVTRLRLSRSKKSGKGKGYAFIEFHCDEVAKIVAETMNNYLMFERLLKCKYVPKEEQHPTLFKGAQRQFSKPKSHLLAIKRHNTKNQDNKQTSTAKRFLKGHQKRIAALAKVGVKLKIKNVELAVAEAKKTKEGKPSKETESSNKEGQVNQKAVDTDKETEIPNVVDTPPNKRRRKINEVKSEPTKTLKRKRLEKSGQSTSKKIKSLKSLKKTPVKKLKLSI